MDGKRIAEADPTRGATNLGTCRSAPDNAISGSVVGRRLKPRTLPDGSCSVPAEMTCAKTPLTLLSDKLLSRSMHETGSAAISARHARASPHRPACKQLLEADPRGCVRFVHKNIGTGAGRAACACMQLKAVVMTRSSVAQTAGLCRGKLSKMAS